MQCNIHQPEAIITQKQWDPSQVTLYHRKFESRAVNSDWVLHLELLSIGIELWMIPSILMSSWPLGYLFGLQFGPSLFQELPSVRDGVVYSEQEIQFRINWIKEIQ